MMRRWLLCSLLVLWCVPTSAALLFDGTDDRVETANVTGVPTTYPISMAMVTTVTTASLANFPSLIHCGDAGASPPNNGYWWYLQSNGRVTMWNPGSGLDVTTTGTVPLNTPIFVGVASASATSHRMFVYNYATRAVTLNETFTTNLGTITTPTTSCKLASGHDNAAGYNSFLGGTLTWAALYAKDLTLQSGLGLQAIAFLGPYALATPALLYTFNEMTGTTTRDRQGTGNTGTLTNFPGSPWQAIQLPGPIAP